MRILIYGGSSYLGKHLSQKLLSSGHRIAHVDRKNRSIEKVEYFDSKTELISAIDSFQPSIIFYLSASYDNNNIQENINVNITTPLTILEKIKNKSNIEFLYTTSYWQLGNKNVNIPIDLYSTAKKSMSEFLCFYNQYNTIRCKEILLYGIYGNRPEKLLDNLLDKANNKQCIELTDGQQKLNLVHIDAVCQAVIDHVLPCKQHKFTIHSSKEYSPREIVSLINLEIELQVKWGAKAYREVELMQPTYSNEYQKIIIKDSLPAYISKSINSS